MSGSTHGIGHNNGPAMDRGVTYRRHVWKKAREELVPTLPLFVLKMRVRRAKELGLDYTTYASVRASTGRDVIGFLFSSNALRMTRVTLPEAQARKVSGIKQAGKIALVQAPLDPGSVAAANPVLDRVHAAPTIADSWTDMRAKLRSVMSQSRLPPDGVIVIGSTALEREWSPAARAAGYLPGERYFGERT